MSKRECMCKDQRVCICGAKLGVLTQQKDAGWEKEFDKRFPSEYTRDWTFDSIKSWIAQKKAEWETQARQQALKECLGFVTENNECTHCRVTEMAIRANIKKLMQKNGERYE